MSAKSTKEMLKESAIEGAKRNAVRKVTEAAMLGLRSAFATAGPGADGINALLGSELAEPIAKTAVGYAAEFVPQLKDNKVLKVVGEECRDQGAEDFQRLFLGKLMESVVPAVMSAVSKLENNPAYRMLEEESNKADTIESYAKAPAKSATRK